MVQILCVWSDEYVQIAFLTVMRKEKTFCFLKVETQVVTIDTGTYIIDASQRELYTVL